MVVGADTMNGRFDSVALNIDYILLFFSYILLLFEALRTRQ